MSDLCQMGSIDNSSSADHMQCHFGEVNFNQRRYIRRTDFS